MLSSGSFPELEEARMLTGSCLCGGVKYEAEGPLHFVARCHCVQCRKASGAEFATNGSVRSEDFRIVGGKELLGRYESSPGRFRVFCSRCGSPLFKEDVRTPFEVRLRLGCLDSDQDQTPLFHLYVAEKPSWSEITDGLPQYAKRPDST
jgi:hypothetical protein